ncbi:MAG: hypothetical protein DRG24_03200 [Epsilonproteobacteria bacterium]|nr:MAG: hypothetical protein DRG24_03200 [Campylobacterota bacterium]
MQLKTKLSIIASSLIVASSLAAEDYVSVQFVQYDESDDRASVSTPSIEFSKDFGVDYNLKLGLVADSISGGSPTWFDTTSGASAYSRGEDIHKDDVAYGNVEYDDKRVAGSALFTTRFASRDELAVGLNYSRETDYEARELSAEYLYYLGSSKNQSLSLGLSYQFNNVLVECIENEACDANSGASQTLDVNVVSAEVGFTQILNQNSLAKASIFYSNEDGYLSNPYMNVVRSYNPNSSIVDVVAENKPDTRVSYGATLQYIVALTDQISSNSTYRFYDDDWDIMSHTISSELYYELGRSWILGAGLRYYTQSEAKFYRAGYFGDEMYASSDERMRDFDAWGYKINADYLITNALSVNVGLNFYDQQDTFNATYYNIGLKYSF